MENWLLQFLLLCLVATTSQSLPSSEQPRSHFDECVALLEFRGNFNISNYGFITSFRGRNLGPWKMIEGDTEGCCPWDGVECDGKNGHVIGLDLSITGLDGFINSSSSLFHLLHLQKLNLAFNHFSGSQIPPEIGNLTSLVSLNLSRCGLEGQVPPTFFLLKNISSLDLSGNSGLEINLENLVANSNKLEELDLSFLKISGIPSGIGNLSSLRSLVLGASHLKGDLPTTIFELPKLQVVVLNNNHQLSVHLPEFHSASTSSPLKVLSLGGTNFSSELPNSLGRLGSLNVLDLSDCNIKGSIPSSISNLTHLSVLDLSYNNFHCPISSLANLSQLTSLWLVGNQLSGDISSSIKNLILLDQLNLSYNNFTGPFPQELINMTRLVYLDLSFNQFHGRVQLELLFHHLPYLRKLSLEHNKKLEIAGSDVSTSPSMAQLRDLQLASCNVQQIPKILQNQEKLFRIDLSCNNISGKIPEWFFNVSVRSLLHLNLSHNLVTGFRESRVPFEWEKLSTLDLRYNELQGSVPIPPKSIVNYLVSNNGLTGQIPPYICNCSHMETLDISRNHVSGAIPQCFGNLTDGHQNILYVLSLHGNNLSGRIPLAYSGGYLEMVDLSDNQFEGPLPRSLSNFSGLEFLNLGNNMIVDTFPSWLGSLPSLKVLILRRNKFHGAIKEEQEEPNKGVFGFTELNIIDLSQNDFQGYLPSKYFESWTSMTALSTDQPDYLYRSLPYLIYSGNGDQPVYRYGDNNYDFSLTIINKGLETEYAKILDYFTVIDFSSNNFSGEIPISIASLKGLHLLNLSNNVLTGPIPPFLGDLVNLEALDLSQNNLSGQIPKQLTRLTFLAYINVSHNNLSGLIPRGKQFNTTKGMKDCVGILCLGDAMSCHHLQLYRRM